MIDLPKHKEDFGQTLGYWGVPSGSYLVLPFFGPSSPRDAVGIVGDALLNPLTYVSAFGTTAVSAAVAGSKALDITDRRANLMTTEKIVNEGSVDRYDFIKNSYEQNREYLINDGNSPEDPDLLDESSGAGNNTNKNTAAASPAPAKKNSTTTKTDASKPPAAPGKAVPGKAVHFLELTEPK
jgi:phospholipid-binding lipoprotein MlaA